TAAPSPRWVGVRSFGGPRCGRAAGVAVRRCRAVCLAGAQAPTIRLVPTPHGPGYPNRIGRRATAWVRSRDQRRRDRFAERVLRPALASRRASFLVDECGVWLRARSGLLGHARRR